MPVFFIPSSAVKERTVIVTGSLFSHIAKSLRTRIGETLHVVDDQRQRHSVIVEEIKKDFLIGSIQETILGPPKVHPPVTLVQADLKRDKMAWVIQKATELGVDSIAPIISERVQGRSERAQLEHQRDRWQRIALEAAQQSERWDIPTVYTSQVFSSFLQGLSSQDVNLILTERGDHENKILRTFKASLSDADRIVVVVGPEGGWSQREIFEANKAGCRKITLGDTIYRSETAAFIGLVLLKQQLEQLSINEISESGPCLE